jgi:aminocarboxymuconate-semialdehyde decarboxylase
VLDRFPSLRLLLAHSGGALPQLSSRLASCIVRSRVSVPRTAIYLHLPVDAVAYGPEELGFVADVISRSEHFESRASGNAPNPSTVIRAVGSKRMLFGTDHPFFPPLQKTEKWKSVVENLNAIDAVTGWGQAERDGVRGGNALSLFNLV